MHIVSEGSLNIFLKNFFFNRLGHGLFGSGQVDPQKLDRVTGQYVFASSQVFFGTGWVSLENSDPFCHV